MTNLVSNDTILISICFPITSIEEFMNIYKVCLFGHREIDDLIAFERVLSPLIKEVMLSHEHTQFFIGRNGEFDEFGASVIKRVRKRCNADSELTLVLPYKVSNIFDYERYYDGIIIPECAERSHFKSAIDLRNKWMIDNSDAVIVFVKKPGGAYNAMTYAVSRGKPTVNLANKV